MLGPTLCLSHYLTGDNWRGHQIETLPSSLLDEKSQQASGGEGLARKNVRGDLVLLELGFPHELVGIDAHCPAHLDEFSDVEPPFSQFNLGDKGLPAPNQLAQLRLG